MKRFMLCVLTLLILFSATLAEPEELAAAFAAELLQKYTFIDGMQFEETAMLLLEDAQGQVFFAGCVKEGNEWRSRCQRRCRREHGPTPTIPMRA